MRGALAPMATARSRQPSEVDDGTEAPGEPHLVWCAHPQTGQSPAGTDERRRRDEDTLLLEYDWDARDDEPASAKWKGVVSTTSPLAAGGGMTNHPRIDPPHMVELRTEHFDPTEVSQKARHRATVGKKRLAEALGIVVAAIPGADRELHLLQLTKEPDTGTAERLQRQHQLTLAHGIGGLAFLERLTRTAVTSLRRDPAVRACIAYWPDLKLHPGARKARRVELGLVDVEDIDAVSSLLETLGVHVVRVNDDRGTGGTLSLLSEPGPEVDLLAVASIDDVAWIAPVGQLMVDNLDVAAVAQGGRVGDHPIWERGLHGENMVIGVIDAGAIDLLSQFLRAKVLQDREAVQGDDSVPPGHPTWVSGCAVADDELDPGGHPNRGGAWAAKMTYGDVFRFSGDLPTASLTEEFQAATDAGAMVHTNSWSIGVEGAAPAYDGDAADIDAFLWRQEQLICVQAAPNPGANFRRALVVAKNPVVVGGVKRPTENEPAKHNERRPDPLPLTADGRRKPDLLGVAENVTTSSLTNEGADPLAVATLSGNSFTTPHVAAAAALVRQYFTERWYPSGKKDGDNHLFSNPSGALLKAMLLNATVPLQQGEYPEERDGWGRLKLDETLYFEGDRRRLLVWDVPHALGFEERDSRHWLARRVPLTVPRGASSMKITLVFNDPPGHPSQDDPAVNMLYLVAHEPVNGSRFDTRPFTGYFSNDFDDDGESRRVSLERFAPWEFPEPGELKNNVQQIVVESPMAGRWFLAVVPHKVDSLRTPRVPPGRSSSRRSQGFALVARLDLG